MKVTKAVVLMVMVVIGVLVSLVALISTSDWELFSYPTNDMAPTIAQNETIVISKSVQEFGRGQIIMFKYPGDHSQMFVKRVVGLPGERISIAEGRVFIGREPLDEPYLNTNVTSPRRSFPEFEIPAGSYYVLGDNRDASNDSRMWGPLSANLIYGRVLFK